MSSIGATHGTWCNSRTFPTRCKYCGEEVFFFSCNCGCKVYFDGLGVPWPEHSCLEYKIAVYGKEAVEEAFAARMMQPGYSRRGYRIQREYEEKVRRQRESDRHPQRLTVAIEPASYMVGKSEPVKDLGRLTEIIVGVDAFRRSNIDPDNPIGSALIQSFAKETMCQVTFLVDVLADADRESYTCFVSQKEINTAGAQRGDLLEFHLVAENHPVLGCYWKCTKLMSLF